MSLDGPKSTTIYDHPFEPEDPERWWDLCKHCNLAESSHVESTLHGAPPYEPPTNEVSLDFMRDRTRLLKILHFLKPSLPDGQWFINGSGALSLAMIDNGRPMGDLDIFVATYQWFKIANQRDNVYQDKAVWRLKTPDPNDPEARHDPPYLTQEIFGLNVDIFFTWRTRFIADLDCNYCTANAEIIAGYPCAPLDKIIEWKSQKLRGKDAQDIAAIQRARPDLFPGKVSP